MKKKALIAMSGGVDSSVAAYLVKQQGFDCIGVTMKLFDNNDTGIDKENTCCALKTALDAQSVAQLLDIPHYIWDFSEQFKEQVIDRFVKAYKAGATPNPCIYCNRYLKFGMLLDRAKEQNIDYIVTGHYARITYDAGSGRYLLKKAVDETKDQSYVLYALTQEQLEHTMLPLGDLTKKEVRAIAAGQGFISADKRDSQDICFVPDGDYAHFIEQYMGKFYESGDFIDIHGNVLGKHKGLIRYTVGQRKGLGLSLPKPMYVSSKNVAANTVTLCEHDGLFSKSLHAVDFNWITDADIGSPIRIKAKIRYKHTEEPAVAVRTSQDTVHMEFDEPQRAIARGQAVVLYDGDIVTGGGTIL